MRLIVFISTFFIFFISSLWSGSSKPSGGFRIHLQMGNDQQSTNQTAAVALTDPEETITISVVPDMNENQIAEIKSIPKENGEMGMAVIFDPRGTSMLNYLTIQGQGRIMVIYLNNRIVYSPMIDSIIADGVLIIPSGVTPQDIQSLQALVKKLNS